MKLKSIASETIDALEKDLPSCTALEAAAFANDLSAELDNPIDKFNLRFAAFLLRHFYKGRVFYEVQTYTITVGEVLTMKPSLIQSLVKEAIDNREKDDYSCTAEEVADYATKLRKEFCNPFDKFVIWVAGIFILTFYKGRTFREVPSFDITVGR